MPPSNWLLPINHPLYAEIVQFLYREAELLDARRFSEWIELMAADITYRVPLGPTEDRSAAASLGRLDWFDDDLETLRLRVSRLASEFAYAENPPSKTRHMLTNIRVWATEMPERFDVVANILVHRYRGSRGSADVFCGERRDVLRRANGAWQLAKRTVVLDQETVGTGSLGIFL
jgi:3-phenylpropionate/cinnamic acid dioxygenase small subunit